MDAFITSLGFEPLVFFNHLKDAKGHIAGSAVLACILNEDGKVAFEPGDLDIWLPYRDTGELWKSQDALMRHIKEKGFKLTVSHRSNVYYENMCSSIDVVNEYKNAANKKINVICTKKSVTVAHGQSRFDIESYMEKNFDLTCCMAYYDPNLGECVHLHKELTLKGEMMFTLEARTHKHEARIKKYEGRGFKLIREEEEGPQISEDSSWHKETCTDILTFDEHTVAEWLKTGGNIVIKSGENYYAFTRRALVDYLAKHLQPHGCYKSPLGHIVRRSCVEACKKKTNYILNVVQIKCTGAVYPPFNSILEPITI